ncbi:uncharacterized protein N7515_005853 [Penicillium bovifimosum]|uniref:PLD phosphodiesterase domain-containing protein n=1 Tax=Penicillium bovifimosum TaxID=126998 RepID=A0A9W9L090_9EURO|nr:uncharacterized protein N7515_005853 [Penicillium bovifimosum]KAJ5129814.1 hypothetical protein N7515_005853 [Penicillium bovifimosum]
MALIQSSNIQDNDNLEMLSHIEGPIVDSFYDAALLSWGKALEPPFPLLNSPARDAAIPCCEDNADNVCTVNGFEHLPEHTTKSPNYDIDINHEAQRVNGSVHPQGAETRTEAVTRHLTPNHSSIYTPQNSAWLSAINNAQHSILIQTPNMNAEPLLEPLLNAARRGVTVSCYLCLGYNDAGELLPFQNGTNEMIANRLYTSLQTEEEKSRLRVYYYVGKDQTRPIHNSFKMRSCHIKLMIVDEQIAIQGNGNLDTQSFFHSQEINVLIDSAVVCRAWTDLINRNQNTAKYGKASSKDGCWHDPETGELPPHSIGPVPGRFSWAKGAVGAVKRVRGAGGF